MTSKRVHQRSSVRGTGAFEGLLSRVAHTNDREEFEGAWREVIAAIQHGELTPEEQRELQPVGIYLAQRFAGTDPGPVPARLQPFLRAHHEIAGQRPPLPPASYRPMLPPASSPRASHAAKIGVSRKRPMLPRASGYVPPEAYAYRGDAFPAPRGAHVKPAEMDEIGRAAIAASRAVPSQKSSGTKVPARVVKMNRALSDAYKACCQGKQEACCIALRKACRLLKACTPAQKKLVHVVDLQSLCNELVHNHGIQLHNLLASSVQGAKKKEGTMPKKAKKASAKKAPKKKTTAKKAAPKKKKPAAAKKAAPKKRAAKKKAAKRPAKRKPAAKKAAPKKRAAKKAAPKKAAPKKAARKRAPKKSSAKKSSAPKKKKAPKKRKASKKKGAKVAGVGGHSGLITLHQETKGDPRSNFIALVNSGSKVYAAKFKHIMPKHKIADLFHEDCDAFAVVSPSVVQRLRG